MSEIDNKDQDKPKELKVDINPYSNIGVSFCEFCKKDKQEDKFTDTFHLKLILPRVNFDLSGKICALCLLEIKHSIERLLFLDALSKNRK